MIRPKKVVIIADSIAMPRGKDWGNIGFEQTYPALLHGLLKKIRPQTEFWVLPFGKRFRSSWEVLEDQREYVELIKPDVVIIQIGGADCAPRLLLPQEISWIKNQVYGPLAHRLLGWEKRMKARLIRWGFGRTMTSVHDFQTNLESITACTKSQLVHHVIWINIPYASHRVEQMIPGCRANVVRYNRVLLNHTQKHDQDLLDLHQLVLDHGGPETLTVDGTHISPQGQILMGEKLARMILQKLDAQDQ